MSEDVYDRRDMTEGILLRSQHSGVSFECIYDWTLTPELVAHVQQWGMPKDPFAEAFHQLQSPQGRLCQLVLARSAPLQGIVGSVMILTQRSQLVQFCPEALTDSSATGALLFPLVSEDAATNCTSREILQGICAFGIMSLENQGCKRCVINRVRQCLGDITKERPMLTTNQQVPGGVTSQCLKEMGFREINDYYEIERPMSDVLSA
jgi:hypothetical protein